MDDGEIIKAHNSVWKITWLDVEEFPCRICIVPFQSSSCSFNLGLPSVYVTLWIMFCPFSVAPGPPSETGLCRLTVLARRIVGDWESVTDTMCSEAEKRLPTDTSHGSWEMLPVNSRQHCKLSYFATLKGGGKIFFKRIVVYTMKPWDFPAPFLILPDDCLKMDVLSNI